MAFKKGIIKKTLQGEHMKKNTIISEVELSYEELKSLDVHFRELQQKAVVRTLKQTPSDTLLLLKKILSTFRSKDQLNSTEAKNFD